MAARSSTETGGPGPAGPGSAAWRDGVVAAALFFGSLGYFGLTLSRVLELQDEGYFHVLASLVADGAVPHRDFSDLYGPGPYWLNGALHASFAREVLPVRWVIAGFKAAAVAATYLLVRRRAPAGAAGIAAGVALVYWGRPVWLMNSAYAALYTIPLLLVAAVVVARALERDSGRGLLWGGLIAGLATWFKHSLALVGIGGLGVAVWAVSLLGAPLGGGRRGLWSALLPLAAAAVAILLPFASMLDVRDYAIHFLPFHAALAAVAFAVVRSRPSFDAGATWRGRIAPFAAGAAAAPAAALAYYAVVGGGAALARDLFFTPLSMTGYTHPTSWPEAAAWGRAIGVVAAVSAGLLALAGRGRVALGVSAGAVCVLAGLGDPHWPFWAAALDPVLGPLVVIAGVATTVPLWRSPAERRHAALLALPLLLTSLLLLQAYPRASFSVWIVQAAVAPVFGWVLLRWSDLLGVPRSGWRRGGATLLVGAFSVWVCMPSLLPVAHLRAMPSQPLELPGTAGVALDPIASQRMDIRSVEAVVASLDALPRDAPIALLGTSWLVVFASERPFWFPERTLELELVALGILPPDVFSAADEQLLLSRLGRPEGAVVVEEDGEAAARLRHALPRVSEWVDSEFAEVARFGRYRILAPR